MVSGATNFMEASTKHILSTVILPDFIHLYNRGDKKNKFSKPFIKINSTESYTGDMILKFLPEPIHKLKIFYKNYQALYPPDKLVILLT
jgi:hypothetical protein